MNGSRFEAAAPVAAGFIFPWILQSLWVGDQVNGWAGWATWWSGVAAMVWCVRAYAWGGRR